MTSIATSLGNLLFRVGMAVTLVPSLTAAQELRYEIRLNSTGKEQTLAVEVTGSGFRKNDGPLDARLENWGEWSELGRPYLRKVTVNNRPATANDSGTIRLGSGSFVLRYELPVLDDTSAEASEHSLLPRGRQGTAVAFASNTLVAIQRGGVKIPARSLLQLGAPRNGGTFTGWAGFAEGAQSASVLPVSSDENGLYAFGVARPVSRTANGMRVEVASVVRETKRVDDIAAIASRSLPVLQAATGFTPDSVVRIIVERSGAEGVTRGTATKFGIRIALPSGDSLNDITRMVVVHELSHLWIGRRFLDEQLMWFMEGFNDYLALWTAAVAGVLGPDWFAQRLALIADDVAALPPTRAQPLNTQAVGRDNDGPMEQLAYRGGALAAFIFDESLRKAGKGTLGTFVGKLLTLPDSNISEHMIRSTAASMGIDAEFDVALAAAPLGSPWAALHRLGFVVAIDEPTYLAALGISADAGGRLAHLTMGPAVVRAIDPNGPSIETGIVPGDTVIVRGVSRRSRPPTHDYAVTARSLGPYVFGASVISSGFRTVKLEVRGGGTVRTVEVKPRLVEGGVRLSPRWDPSRGSRFFTVSRE